MRLRSPTLAIWRSPGVLQVGLDSPALILSGVPDQLAGALALLANPNSIDELITLLPGLEPSWVHWLLDRLGANGLLEPVTKPDPEPSRLAVVGNGPVAEAVATALAGLSVQKLDPMAHASAALGRTGQPGPALTVLAGTTAEPDRTVTDALVGAARAHLLVRLEPDRAVVGPLVVPGRTPCVRCLDLTRCRLDAAWPHLLAQLCREPVEPDPVLLAWAATTAGVQARAWLAGGDPETGGGTLELSRPDFRLRSRRWPAHPACGCLLPIA